MNVNVSTCAVPVAHPVARRYQIAESPIQLFSKCQACRNRKEKSFCNLSGEAFFELERLKTFRTFAPGERLFSEGEPVQDLMIVCDGAVTLTFSSSKGTIVMLGLADCGEVLGLSSAISGHRQEFTADALVNTRVAIIPIAEFLRFVERFPSVALNVAAALSRNVNRSYEKIRLIGSGLSVPERLAAWLLRLQDSRADKSSCVKITLTHERIAQVLGASRESITRALSHLKKLGVVEVRGIHFYVRDREYLRSLLQPPDPMVPSTPDVINVTEVHASL